MHNTSTLKQLELKAKQYASSQVASQPHPTQLPSSTQPEYLSSAWQGQMPQPMYPSQYTGGPIFVPPPSVMLPPGSSSFISTQQPMPVQSMGMYSGQPNHLPASFALPVPHRPPEPCRNYFAAQQMRPSRAVMDVHPESYFSAGHSRPPAPDIRLIRPQVPDVQPSQVDHGNVMPRQPCPASTRNIRPLVFMPTRRPSVCLLYTSPSPRD